MKRPLESRTVGFIGLGLMGAPMTANLRKAGARMVLLTRTAAKARRAARPGDVVASDPGEVARAAKTIILMLPDTRVVKSVLTGRRGIVAWLQPGSLVIDMGTTGVAETRRQAKRVERAGGAYVDAPVSGGQVGARDGSLVIMAGGTKRAVARAKPLFDVLGSRTTRVGDVGAGQVAKAANQVIVALTICAVAEALALSRAAGVDPARVREALAGGFAASRILELHGDRMIRGAFTPGGRSETQRKDLDQALALARESGLDLPSTRLVRRLYDRMVKLGRGALDHSGLYALYGKKR